MSLFHTQKDLSQEVAVECGTQEEAGVPPLRLPNKRPRKGSNVEDSALRLIQEASASLRATPTHEEAFACMAATKLQDMQEGQRLMCEDILYEILTHGVRGKSHPIPTC
ncbi:hypothetical protein AB205_0147820, partial [Aquarana catesbeiana]